MAKDPAFLFYPGDWLGGTMGMTIEQKGAYMELLVFQFNTGPFTEAQAKQVLSICFARVWQVVNKKFLKEGNTYRNVRLSQEIDRRKKFTESRRINAKSKVLAFEEHKAYAQHMETETENTDSITKEVFSFLKRKGSNTMDVTYMIRQWVKSVPQSEIMPQLQAMKAYYEIQDWPFPNKIDTLTQSFTGADWVEKMKDTDPERRAERIQNAKKTHEPERDTIGTSAPGSLD